MKQSKFAAVFSAALAAAFVLGACAPAATSAPGVTQVVVTAPPIEVTKIVAGTPVTIIITATPGATAVPAATALPAGSIPDTCRRNWRRWPTG